MRLVYMGTDVDVTIGDNILLAEGSVTVTGYMKPHNAVSTGRIAVKWDSDGAEMAYYPSVIGAVWIEREDRI